MCQQFYDILPRITSHQLKLPPPPHPYYPPVKWYYMLFQRQFSPPLFFIFTPCFILSFASLHLKLIRLLCPLGDNLPISLPFDANAEIIWGYSNGEKNRFYGHIHLVAKRYRRTLGDTCCCVFHLDVLVSNLIGDWLLFLCLSTKDWV